MAAHRAEFAPSSSTLRHAASSSAVSVAVPALTASKLEHPQQALSLLGSPSGCLEFFRRVACIRRIRDTASHCAMPPLNNLNNVGAETAREAVLSSTDALSMIVGLLDAASSFRATACVARMWRAAVTDERARRTKLPWCRWGYFGGKEPDRFGMMEKMPCYRRNDIIGSYDTHIPPMPEGLQETSACVLKDGSIVVAGPRYTDGHSTVAYRFMPEQWRWGSLHLPKLVRCAKLVPHGDRGFAAVGGFEDDVAQNSSRLCIYTPTSTTSKGFCTYNEEVRRLVHGCVDACVLTRAGKYEAAFFAYRDKDDSYDESVKHPPMNFPNDAETLCRLPLPIQNSSISDRIGVGGAFVTHSDLHSDLAVVVQPSLSGSFAILWASRPHGGWRKVGFVPWKGIGGFSHLEMPQLAVVELSKNGATKDSKPYLVLGQSFTDTQHFEDAWFGAELGEIEKATSLPQSYIMNDDDPDFEGDNEEVYDQTVEWLTGQQLVQLENLTEYIQTPVRSGAALIAIPPY